MITKEQRSEILRLYHAEKWRINTIAKFLGLSWETVKNAIDREAEARPRRKRKREIDKFVPFIIKKLQEYPRLRATRLYDMVRERGYKGSVDHFRHTIAPLRPRPQAEAYLRLSSPCGEQGQVDWGYFGKVRIGQAERRLMAFVIVLAWSRQVFLRYFLNDRMESFVRGHVAAFHTWEAVPRVLLYDNLKSAVLERRGDAIKFNPTLLDLAGHYRFEPRPVARYRGNEKGRVERAIRYVRDRFFPARRFTDIEDLNRQALEWCNGIAGDRPWKEGSDETVRDAFAKEQPRMRGLPETPFECEERVEVKVGKTPYVRFDLNDYSVPHDRVHRALTVWASEHRLRIFDGNDQIAEHARSFSRAEQIENPDHIAALRKKKRRARKHSGFDRLAKVAPSTQKLFEIQANRGANLGSLTAQLLRLLDTYGSTDFENAVQEALEKEVFHAGAIEQVLDRMRAARGKTATTPIPLKDKHLKELQVRAHDLADYDTAQQREEEDQQREEEDADGH